MPAEKFHRTVRSFVRREGRITRSQKRALAELWQRYSISADDCALDYKTVFARKAPVVFEIGFGNGRSLAEMATAHPEQDYIGVDVHRPGAGSLLLQLENQAIENVRVMCEDAVQVLTCRIPEDSLQAVYLFFPDPWPKKRHHKRRILQPEFVQLVRKRLKINGLFHMATDWRDYAGHMMEVMSQAEGFENTAGEGVYAERPDYRPVTKFELRGRNLGHGVWDLVFCRTS
ncbi:MAG: tRNA (guanosine(46)-N7)-methyltransferase TrmB [Gammaproteobacteria bacterium]|nr:MAG: tRNA (guanosine(46)-N7)-methyltransferase TrmB [Gammaproteobacteria bacterium]